MRFIPYSYVPYPYYYPQLQLNNRLYPEHLAIQTQSPFPPVNPKKLHSSAEQFQNIMREASLFVGKIVSSPEFAVELMEAAQLSNHEKVDELIASTGISIKVTTNFSPTGIQIEFDSAEIPGSCCKLEMTLLW